MASDQPVVTGARTTGSDPSQRNPLVNRSKSDLASRLKQPGQGPPNLRKASRPTQSCASCKYFKAGLGSKGKCRLYSGWPVQSTQVCDSYKA
jgi:hypothetical protein